MTDLSCGLPCIGDKGLRIQFVADGEERVLCVDRERRKWRLWQEIEEGKFVPDDSRAHNDTAAEIELLD